MPVSSIGAGFEPGDLLGDEDALLEATVRELEAGHDVADGEDAGHVGAQPVVGRHEAAVDRDALLLVAEVGRDRTAPDGDEKHFGLDRLAAGDGDLDTGVGVLHLLERLAELEVDATLAERALDLLRRVFVFEGDQVRQRLDDGDVGAERLPRAGELAADHAAAEDDRGGGQRVEHHGVLGGDDADAVDLQAGQRLHVGAGRQHDVLADHTLAVDLDRVRGDQLAGALDVRDLGALHQTLQALVELVDDAVLVGVDALHVDADQLGLDAELLGLARLVGDLTGVQQRLRRDAAAVQARAAELVLLDQRNRQVQLDGTERGRVTTTAAAENYYVKLAHEISYQDASPMTCRFSDTDRQPGGRAAPPEDLRRRCHLSTVARSRRNEVCNDTSGRYGRPSAGSAKLVG